MCTGLILVVGLVMLAVVSIAMRYVPTYNFTAANPDITPVLIPTTLTPTTGAAGATGTTTLATAKPSGIVISSSNDILATLFVTSGIALLVIGGLGAVLSWFVAGRMLRPLESLASAAERTATGSLSHRVGLDGPDDEFTRLSRSFDDMLDRLERSFTAHERFAANASHELRTPLATTKALLDVGRDGIEDTAVPDLLERLSETNDRSLDIVEAMLDLSDVARTVISTDTVDLGPIVASELELVADEAGATGVALTFTEPGTDAGVVAGDAALLHRLTANLLINAVRHNDDRGEASVTISTEGPMRVLRVENTGDDLSDAQLAVLREPFYRARGRVRAAPRPTATGSSRATHGLGLALVANIVDVHGGELELVARPGGGLIASVRLAAARPDSEGSPSLAAHVR
ncbi:sensor histidine kinase [Plantibacter sp. Mn2098]|uniref:sensor histidine kinase n=1 Tax=Plantibacter sp. Mn2098 TaxID=3395266 RepID=UPI003BE3872A